MSLLDRHLGKIAADLWRATRAEREYKERAEAFAAFQRSFPGAAELSPEPAPKLFVTVRRAEPEALIPAVLHYFRLQGITVDIAGGNLSVEPAGKLTPRLKRILWAIDEELIAYLSQP